MKSKRFMKEWERKSYEEFVIFYSMCGKRDKAFFDAPKKERKIEDYARLMYIALSFGFKKVALRIIANVGNEKEFQQFLNKLFNDTPTVVKWFENFVREIPILEFKKLAVGTWEEMRKKINGDDFDIRNFLL